MEQSGEAPEPEQPAAAQPTSPLPPPGATLEPDDPGPRDGRWFIIGGILALVVVIGAIAWMVRPDDGLDAVGRTEERFPTPTTLPPPTTVPPSTTPAASVPAPTTVAPVATPLPTPAPTLAPVTTTPATPPSTVAATPPPGTTLPGAAGPAPVSVPADDPDYAATLVPSVAAFTDFLSTPELVSAEVDAMLTTGRHDIAVPGPTASICVAIAMDRPLAVRGRWERDGRRVASSDLDRRDAPGYGECLTNDGDAIEDGSYQYIASDSNGNESAAGGIVVGAGRVEQPLRNDGAVAICAVRIAPSASRYFEVYVYAAQPIDPGAQVTLAVAAVDQDVETVGCDDEELAAFSFTPSTVVQSLAP